MASQIISAGNEVLTLEDVKNYLVVNHSQHDQFIAYLIRAARTFIEREIDQDIVTRVRRKYYAQFSELDYDSFTNQRFAYLTEGPVKEITSITYIPEDSDEAGTNGIAIINADNYELFTDEKPDMLYFEREYSVTTNRTHNSLCIEYETVLDNPTDESILQMMYLTIGDWYEQKQDSIPGNFKEMNLGVSRIRDMVKNMYL